MLVQTVPVHGMALPLLVLVGGGAGIEEVIELNVVGIGVTSEGGVEAGVKGSPGLVGRLDELTVAALSLNKEDNTLRTELVRVNVPGGMVGVVPASDIVGEVVRPRAPLSAVLTPLEVLIAGVTEDKALVDVDTPDGA